MSHALELELHDMVSNSYVSKSCFSKKASIWEDKSGQRKNRFSQKKKEDFARLKRTFFVPVP